MNPTLAASLDQSNFSQKLLDTFTFAAERESMAITQEFINGELMEKLLSTSTSQEEASKKYHHQCLRSLDWSFNDTVVRDPVWLPIFAGSIEEMEHFIRDAISLGVTDPDAMRDRLPLDNIPFKYSKRKQKDIHAFPKDDEIRIAFQALFLFLLRPFVPLKYNSIDDFLEQYPAFKERSALEQERLRNTANWMDLSFYTIQPRNNKTFILNLIPRIVEGRNARYITGSGQTRPTADRVDLFRVEGNCEKIKRPPRRKKDDNGNNSASGDDSSFKKPNLPTGVEGMMLGKDKVQLIPSPFGALDPTKASFPDASGQAFIPAAPGNIPFPMLIPCFPPGYSYPPTAAGAGCAETKTEEAHKSGDVPEVKTEVPNNMMFPFPIVLIPQQMISEEDAKKGLTPQAAAASLWGGGFPMNFPGFAPVLPGATDANSSAAAASAMSFPLLQAMMQQQALSPNGAAPFLCYPQMMMPTVKSNDSNGDGAANLKRQSPVPASDESKPKKKRVNKNASATSAIPGPPALERTASAGEGLELLLAAAGDLEPGAPNDVFVN